MSAEKAAIIFAIALDNEAKNEDEKYRSLSCASFYYFCPDYLLK